MKSNLKNTYLLTYLQIHSTTKKYKCHHCNKAFSENGNLQKHIKSVHEGIKPTKKYKCNSCNKFFRGDSARYFSISWNIFFKFAILQILFFINFRYRHFRNVHEGIKDHYCGICGKSFTSYGVLKNHLKTIHSDSKDFVCDICTKAFAEKGQRKSHINIVHKGIKNYKCDFW